MQQVPAPHELLQPQITFQKKSVGAYTLTRNTSFSPDCFPGEKAAEDVPSLLQSLQSDSQPLFFLNQSTIAMFFSHPAEFSKDSVLSRLAAFRSRQAARPETWPELFAAPCFTRSAVRL